MVKPVPALGSFHTGSPSHCAAAGVASNAVSPSSNIVRFISPSQRLGETVQDQGARSGGDGPTVGTAARGVNAVSLYGTHTAPIDTRLLGYRIPGEKYGSMLIPGVGSGMLNPAEPVTAV